MTLTETKKALTQLGKFLHQFKNGHTFQDENVLNNSEYFTRFSELITQSQSHNGWFTPDQVYFAVEQWAEALTDRNLDAWLAPYNIETVEPKTVALVLAGNIPLVGFHDFLSVLITGHNVLVKLSSNDNYLLPFLANYLISVQPGFAKRITFTDGKLEGFDAVIATGSNNTARYFEYYFKQKPNIIRKNRNSVAVLSGNETKEELTALGEDIFRYYGLGCRNVSKLFVPEGYDFKDFFEAIFAYADVIEYEKYANNYDYNKAVFLMSNFKILDNGFLTLKEDTGYASPISSVFYEYYTDLETVKQRLQAENELIQCVVSRKEIGNTVAFGQTQKPALSDYADNVDTIAFLSTL
ncbi:acyl-CoA reductase [Flavobacterium rhizosphaerae]|uniref:Acyl-CoA reductase n=1 Tax=Flavobacterium rhizosphaerae TaxID=3163298 RepID=A0ABW8YSS3_9FLAO